MTPETLRSHLRGLADERRALLAGRFFKTGPGQYGEGDRFLGVTVPQVRSLLPMTDAWTPEAMVCFLKSEWHEERLLALLSLVRRFQRSRKDEAVQSRVVELYLENREWVNNWDLVDTSAPHLTGVWFRARGRAPLERLACSGRLWEERIAVLSTQGFIRAGDLDDTFRLARKFLGHRHDLMHKACGWMLREAGKKDVARLTAFLREHAPSMPRVMLRYAVEKLSEAERASLMRR